MSNAYFNAVTDLGMRMLRLLALALGLAPDYFLPMFGRPMLFLRPLHYIPRRSQPDQARAHPKCMSEGFPYRRAGRN